MRKTVVIAMIIGAAMLFAAPAGAFVAKTGDMADKTNRNISVDEGVLTLHGLLSEPQAGAPEEIAIRFMRENLGILNLDETILSGLRHLQTKESLTAFHVRYQQTCGGYDVIGGQISAHIRKDGVVQVVHNGIKSIVNTFEAPLVHKSAAFSIAKLAVGFAVPLGYVPQNIRPVVLPIDGGVLAWQTFVPALEPLGAWTVYIDTKLGTILGIGDMASYMEIPATLFRANPVVLSKDPNFKDNQLGINDESFDGMYTDVLVKNLDDTLVAIGMLSGPHAFIIDNIEFAVDGVTDFVCTREDPRFEGLMCYFGIDESQLYIQSFGFTDLFNKPMSIAARGLPGVQNAMCVHGGVLGLPDPFTEVLILGWHALASTMLPAEVPVAGWGGDETDGFIDTAEDPIVVLHEYGHAILGDAGFTSGGAEGGAVHEGFADWWGSICLAPYSDGLWDNYIGEWFSSYIKKSEAEGVPPALRNMVGNKTYDDMEGEVHVDGEIWSSPLWDIWMELGRENASRLVLESIHFLPASGGFEDAAFAVLQADVNLNNGENGYFLLKTFEARLFEPAIPEGLNTLPPVVDSGASAQETETKGTPGFEAVSLIGVLFAGLVALVRRRQK